MRDAFTENLCKLLRQDLKDMEAGRYVSPLPAPAMFSHEQSPSFTKTLMGNAFTGTSGPGRGKGRFLDGDKYERHSHKA